MCAAWFFGLAALIPADSIADIELRDAHGQVHHLRDWRESRIVVVAFVGIDCPLAKLYAAKLAHWASAYQERGVAFVGIDSNGGDSAESLLTFAQEHEIPFPLLRDPSSTVAGQFGATRTPQVFVLDEKRAVRYHGRIDDQYGVGGRKASPTREDLVLALEELLAGKPVSVPKTPVAGCLINRASPTATGTLTYWHDVAPIIRRHCLACHRPGQMAPFSFTTYAQVRKRATAMLEAIRARRMPPWHADPRYGTFANDLRVNDTELEILTHWLEAGLPEGELNDAVLDSDMPDNWNIPKPDLILALPRPITIPAQGTMEYEFIEVDAGFKEDKWIRGAEIRPSNRKVVHHCNVFLKPPGSDSMVEQGALGSFCLAAMAVGTPPLMLPEGMAKKVPAGWHFIFVLHYTPIGSTQEDQTSLGLVFADPRSVRKEVATRVVLDENLNIPPRCSDWRVEHSHTFDHDVLLLAFFPHMHLRGKSFCYEATYPDGRREILLNVPRFDFNWQNRYVLAEPKRLPAGTELHCIAHYDNSTDNPYNPDPDVTVHTGLQSTDEMFNGYYEYALADQDLTRRGRGYFAGVGVALGLLTLCGYRYVTTKGQRAQK